MAVGSVSLVVVLGELVQTTTGKWITHPPTRCPNGHHLGPGQVLVGHQACLGHGGGHTTWTCRTCDETVYGAAHRGTNCTNVEASQNYGICCAQRPDQAPAWLASRSAREETSMKKLAIRREHRINETQAESAIKDYVDHVADIAKFPDATGGTPDFDTPLGDTLPASIDPETAAGLASNLRAALPRIRELLGLLTRRGKEDG